MTAFRKFMINNYWGKGYTKLFGRWTSYYKGGPRNFFTLLAIGILRIIFDQFNRDLGDTIITVLVVVFVLWVLYTGFNVMGLGYWIKNPVKYEELESEIDKWVFGQAWFASEGEVGDMTGAQIQEWKRLDDHYKRKFSGT